MGWEDKMRENMYLRNSFRANSVDELDRLNQNSDRTIEMVKGFGNALFGPSNPPRPLPKAPPPKATSGGVGLGGLLAAGVLAGGAYLLKKAFSGDNKQKANSVQSSDSNKSKYPETEW